MIAVSRAVRLACKVLQVPAEFFLSGPRKLEFLDEVPAVAEIGMQVIHAEFQL